MNEEIEAVGPSSPPSGESPPGWLDLLSVAARPRRFAVLTVLSRHEQVSRDELAEGVVATVHGIRRADVTDEQCDDARAVLYHQHLPTLRERSLVEYGDAGATTSIRPGPAFDPEQVECVREIVEAGVLDGPVLSALADRGRQRVVSALAKARGPVELDALARTVSTGASRVYPCPGIEDVRIRLHHVDLPRLAAADVVEYCSDVNVATYRGLPAPVEAALRRV